MAYSLEVCKIAYTLKERATLRHNAGTSQWSRVLRTAASRDPKLREQLQDQLRAAKQLREKHAGEEVGHTLFAVQYLAHVLFVAERLV